jgi:hypothetical protein
LTYISRASNARVDSFGWSNDYHDAVNEPATFSAATDQTINIINIPGLSASDAVLTTTTTDHISTSTDRPAVPLSRREECVSTTDLDPDIPSPNCAGDPARYHLFLFSHDYGAGGFYSEWRGLNCHGTKRCTPCNVEPAWTQAAAREGPVTNPALPQSLKGLNVFGDTCSYTEDSDATMKVQGTLKCEKWKDAVCGKGPDVNYACGNGVWASYMLVCQWPGNYFEHLDN